MPEPTKPTKRVIVDGIEFAQVFQFQRILGAITASLQPARLVIGLLMVTALITFGRVWDAATNPSVHPDGLSAEPGSVYDENTLRDELRLALNTFPPETSPEAPGALIEGSDARRVLKQIQKGYLRLRADADTPEERTEIDRRYERTVATINKDRPKGAFEATAEHLERCFMRSVRGAIDLRPREVFDATADIVLTPYKLWQARQRRFTVVYGLFFVLVFSIGGGALARMAAVQFASDGERLTLRKAVDFALSHWLTLTWAQLMPLILALLLCAALAVMGLLMGLPVLDVIGALIYGLAILLGFVVALLLLGYVLGFPLIVPSVACESSDAADAVQRSYSYVIGRPLRLIGYWIVAKIGWMLGYVLVALFAMVTLDLTAAAFGWLTNNPAMTIAGGYDLLDLSHQRAAAIPTWHSSWAATIISFWQMLVVSLVIAYLVVYHFSAATIVYLLMRHACDGQTTDDIWRDEESLSRFATAADANATPPITSPE